MLIFLTTVMKTKSLYIIGILTIINDTKININEEKGLCACVFTKIFDIDIEGNFSEFTNNLEAL